MSEVSFFAHIEDKPKAEKPLPPRSASPEDRFFSHVEQLNGEDIKYQTNLNITRDMNPDKEAENYDLSKRSGLPISTVRAAPEQVSSKLNRPTFTIDNPSPIKRYLGFKSLNAAISGDDIDGLETVQTTWEKTKQALEEGKVDTLINYYTAQRELLGADPVKINRQIEDLEAQRAQLEPFEPEGFIEKVLTSTARQIPQQILAAERGFERAPTGALIGGTAALILGQVPPLTGLPEEKITVPLLSGGAIAGFMGGRAESMFYQEFGGAYREFIQITDEKGNKLDPVIAKTMAYGVGFVNSILEFASFKAIVKTFPGGDKIFKKINSELIKDVVKSKTVRAKLADIALRFGTGWTTEEATEVLQETSNVIFGEIGKRLQGELTGAEFADFDWEAFFSRIKEIATETAYSAFGFMLPGTAISTARVVADSTISKKFHDDNNNMKPVIDESKTQQRSPDHSEKFLEELGMGQPVYISPEGINELYLQSTKEEADTILTKVGVNPAQAKAITATGIDVEITQSKAHAQLTAEEFNKISKDIKPAPGMYTQREIEQQKDQEDVGNTVKLLAEKTQKDKLINQEITRIQEEGKKAGLDEQTVENAPVLIKGLSNRLTLEGVDPVEFLKKVGFKKERFAAIKDFIQAKKGVSPAGGIPISNESHLISLFENADLSTVLHEVGHIALKEYTNLETTGQASDLLKKDMAVVRKWVGAQEGVELSREQSEQFARGFEAYLMEGKAPTAELRTAFERFKHWLIEAYKTAKGLDVKLNKEVRGVFDRMLSANLEVEAVAQSGGFTIKTTAEMDALGVIKADQIFATRLIEQTTEKAQRNLTQARNKGYRENLSTWREESVKEIRNEKPIYNTIDAIIAENNPIDRDEFIDIYTEEAIKLLPNKKLIKKDGLSIDAVAVIYEFEDAFDMVNQFFTTPKLSEAVNQRVNQKQAAHDAQFLVEDYIVDLPEYRDYLNIMARYIAGQTVDEGVISKGLQQNINRWEAEAREQAKRIIVKLTPEELEKRITDIVQKKIDNWQRKKGKPSVISTDSLKRLANETISAKTVREAKRVDKYLSAMKKASSDERRAILKGDWGKASDANELARFNYELAGLSVKIRGEVDTIQKRAKRIGRRSPSTIDFEHKEAVLHLVDRFKLASLIPAEPDKTPDFAKLFAGDDYGNDGYIVPDFLFRNVANDFRDLRMEQLREVDNAIRYLDGQGSKKRQETLSDGETLLQDEVDRSVEVQDTVKPLKVWEKGSMMRKLSEPSRRFFARLDSLTFTAKSLDGYTNLGKEGVKGPVEDFIIDGIKDAGDAKIKSEIEIRETLTPHLNQIEKTVREWHKQFGNNIRIEGAPVPFLMRADGQTKGWHAQQIFAVVLNTGNIGEASNYESLLAGYPDLTPAMVENTKNMLSVEDMRAVQGIWDAMNSLFPEADQQHFKIKNYHMTKVEADPFRFKDEEFKGGYYPLKHDRNLSYQVDDRGKIEDLFNSDAASFTAPYTKSGQTIKRVRGVALPVLLDLSVIDAHFKDTLQYIHFSDIIRDADRITRHPDFRKAATNILGKDVYDTIRPALQHIANPKREGLDIPGARAIEWMRGLSTLYVLAWNTGVAIKQPLSTFGAIKDMGARAYLDGFSSVFMAPSVHYQKMLKLSPYMKDRLTAFDRELKSAFLKLTKAQKGIYFDDTKVTWQDVKNFGFWQIRAADTATVLPIWHGAFQDKLLDDQSNLDEAVRYADDIVRNSQPSAQPLDLSSWQRDGGVIRLFSQFQTFTVGKYGQRQRLNYRAWRNKSISDLDYAWFNFMDAFVPLVTINLLQALIWGRDIDDDENLKDMVFDILQKWAFMGVPLVSNIARSIYSYGDPFDSPVLETGNKLVRSVVSGAKGLDGFKNRKEREQALWGIAHTISILSGVPVSKIVSRAEKGAKAKDAAPGIKYLVPPPKK